jgi:1,4-alpha-glucan branching enzyme
VADRVWAPFASSVCVAGSFNGWSVDSTPLTPEGNSSWSVDVPGVQVKDQYKFVLRNPAIATPLWKNDPSRSMTNSAGNSIVADPDYVWQSRGYAMPPWNELVIYELHVGSFLFDRRNATRRGNFDTVISKLDYLQDLGINAVQVMAADEFPGDVSWGYNPAQIFAIEASYGSPNGFRRLVDAAHARGIEIIFDVVYNHLGPSDLDMWKFDGCSPNGRDDEGGIYFYNDWRKHTPWGRHAARLWPRGGAPVHPRQRSALARAALLRRPAVGRDGLDSQRLGSEQRPRRRHPGRMGADAVDR